MNSALRTTLLLAIASSCIDAQAKPVERCILSLEARPANGETPGEPAGVDRFGKPRCPLAVAYSRGETATTDARNPRILSPIASDDEASPGDSSAKTKDAAREAIAPHRSMLHV